LAKSAGQPAESARAPWQAGGARGRLLRWAVSLLIVLHFSAVLSAASSVGEASPLVLAIWGLFRPYLQVLYLNQGYNFFAPQPAPTTLLDFEVHRPDGSSVRGRLPDHSMQPRLLYHRHLLLTEHIVFMAPAYHDRWYISYARHLCHKYKADRVSLTRLTHIPPTMEMVRNGTRLNDPVTYVEMQLGNFECGDP
jgi:hypothetical protein